MNLLSIILLTINMGLTGYTAPENREDKGVVQSVNVEKFSRIVVKSNSRVELHRSDEYKVKVESNMDMGGVLDLNQKGETIYIKLKIPGKKSKKGRKVVVHVYAPTYDFISASDACDIYSVEGFQSENLVVEVNDVGNIKLADLDVTYLEASINDVGNITLSGKADRVKYQIKDVGNIRAFDLETRIAECSIKDVGEIYVTVSNELTAHTRDAGIIKYKGEPNIIRADIRDAGQLINSN